MEKIRCRWKKHSNYEELLIRVTLMAKLTKDDKPNSSDAEYNPVAVNLSDFNQLGEGVLDSNEALTVKLSRQISRAKREREARKTAERLLEEKSLDLYQTNQKLHGLAAQLQIQVDEKTRNLEKALDEAKNATKLKSQFIATISHEMRTPLNAIIGFSDRLITQADISEGNRAKYTKNISTASTQLLGLINDVLDFEKIVSGKLEIDYTSLNLQEIIEDVVDTVSLLAKAHNINISVNFWPDIPKNISGDPLRIRQVFYNLLSNALKFSENNFVAVECKLVAGSQSQIEVTVTDQGIGMSEGHLDNLFSPFMQADGSMARKFGGSGLGLSICKSLVELMGGNIWAYSKLGVGSEFHFTFSYIECEEIIEEKIQDLADLSILEGAKILLVDDQMLNQELGKELLQDMGAVVDLADDGLEAISKSLGKHYDVILMDLQMPECDGFEASKKILLEKPATKIIALTANSTSDIREKCTLIGMHEFLGKPFVASTLFSVVAKTILND